jgi:glycosyltransferase involved in cell wall biosynthesis
MDEKMPIQPVPAPSPAVSLSVFFPCWNEQAAIEPLTQKAVQVLDALGADYEIILVNDGSTDRTGPIADRLAANNPRIRAVHHPVNRGYGAALASGFRAARKDLVFYTDGDGQFDLNELPPLLPLMERFDIVSGYRLNRQEGLVRKFNAFCWSTLVGLLFDLPLKDIDCAFKLYRRRIFDGMELLSTGALIDTEILTRARRRGCTITQVGVHHYPRIAGKATGANPRVILRAFRELFKLRKQILHPDRP